MCCQSRIFELMVLFSYSTLALFRVSITGSPGMNESSSVNGPVRVKMLSRYFLWHKVSLWTLFGGYEHTSVLAVLPAMQTQHYLR